MKDGTLSRKGTKLATNNPWLAFDLFQAQCTEDHDHQVLIGGLPKKAQTYPPLLWNCLAKKRNDEVSLKDMNEEDRKLFEASDDIEWNAVLGMH